MSKILQNKKEGKDYKKSRKGETELNYEGEINKFRMGQLKYGFF